MNEGPGTGGWVEDTTQRPPVPKVPDSKIRDAIQSSIAKGNPDVNLGGFDGDVPYDELLDVEPLSSPEQV